MFPMFPFVSLYYQVSYYCKTSIRLVILTSCSVCSLTLSSWNSKDIIVTWLSSLITESQPVYTYCDESKCLSFCLDIEKRYQVAKEILETEKKYLSCLRTLKEVRFVRLYSRRRKSKRTLICVKVREYLIISIGVYILYIARLIKTKKNKLI